MIDTEYLQIPKGMCAGNKELFNRIKELIEKDEDLRVDNNSMIFTVAVRTKSKPEE